MEVIETTSYQNQIKLLTKKSRDGYKACPEILRKFLDDKSFNQLWDYPRHITDPTPSRERICKYRVADKDNKRGTSSGYRLIVLLFRPIESIFLLFAYPKKGNHKRSTISPDEINDLYIRCKSQFAVKFDIEPD